MINGLQGIPGSGKTYEAVVYHALPALARGRRVVTNLPLVVELFAALDPKYAGLIDLRRVCLPVRGTWDADAANRGEEAFKLFDDGHAEPVAVGVPLFGSVWDFYTEWKGADGNGPLYVIDECHVSFPKIGTSDAVIGWFKLHRHYHADVLLCTQIFRDVCPSITGNLGFLYKLRKADIFGRPKSYIRNVYGGYRGSMVSSEERKYKPQYFQLYRSHTQGGSGAEAEVQDVSPFIVKFKRATYAVVFLAALGAVWWVYSYQKKPAKKEVAASVRARPLELMKAPGSNVVGPANGSSAAAASGQSKEAADRLAAAEKAKVEAEAQGRLDPEPYQNKTIHLSGLLKMGARVVYHFVISQNGLPVATVTDAELASAGYAWRPFFACAGVLTWQGKKAYPVTCDAPQISMGGEKGHPVAGAVSGTKAGESVSPVRAVIPGRDPSLAAVGAPAKVGDLVAPGAPGPQHHLPPAKAPGAFPAKPG